MQQHAPLILGPAQKRVPQYVQRQPLLTPEIRNLLIKLAYDVIDPDCTGEVDASLLNAIRLELGNLIRHHKTREARERQYFIAEWGAHHLNKIEDEEQRALNRSIELGSEEEEDLGAEEAYDSEDSFIAPEDDNYQEKKVEAPPKQLTYHFPKINKYAPDPDTDEDELLQRYATQPRPIVDSNRKKRSRRRRLRKQPAMAVKEEGEEDENGELGQNGSVKEQEEDVVTQNVLDDNDNVNPNDDSTIIEESSETQAHKKRRVVIVDNEEDGDLLD